MGMKFSLDELLAPMIIANIKILVAVLELSAKALPSQPICLIFAVDWLLWRVYLAGSSKTAPRILIFSILMNADYSSKLNPCIFEFSHFLPLIIRV